MELPYFPCVIKKKVLPMEEEFKRAIQKMKELDRIVSVKEWNKVAMEENLLGTTSLKFIAQKSFNKIQLEARETILSLLLQAYKDIEFYIFE